MRVIFKFVTTILFLKLSLFSYAAEYYWVGGSGYWDDISHWRTTSGGSVIPNWVPGIGDNVYFDDNSNFTTESKTILFRTNGLCNNISFIGTDNTKSPILLGASNNITIAGTSVWQAGMEITLNNIYYGDNNITTNRSIKSNNVVVNANIYIRGAGITQLNDNLSSKAIFIEEGSFISNNFEITTTRFETGNFTNTITLDSSIINTKSFDINRNTIVSPNTTQINLETGGSISAYNIQLYNAVFNGTNSSISGSNITFNNVEFKGRSTIYSNGHKFNQLILAPGNYHQIRPGSITIVELLRLDTPQCSVYSTLSNSETYFQLDTPATIIAERVNTEILVSNSVINLINISGQATGIANNVIFNQNNLTGWMVNSLPSPDLYWVGGAGNWNDKAFWSLTSGGTGGACVPGPYNNTFFNDDSKIGTANNFNVNMTGESYTKSITFSGSINPKLNNNSGSSNLNIYGSAIFNPNQRIGQNINLFFKNTSENKTFDPKGLTIDFGSVYFEEEKTIALLSDLNFTIYGIIIRNGTLDLTQATNQITITASSIVEDRLSNNSNLKTLKLGDSKIDLISSNPTIDFSEGNLALDAGTSTITFIEKYESTGAVNIGMLLDRNKDYNFYNVIFKGFAKIVGNLAEGKNTFNILKIENSSNIDSSITANELYLGVNRIHTLVNSPIIAIQDKFIIEDSDCSYWTMLKSNLLNEQSTIKLSASATISRISNFTIKGIKIIDLGDPTRSFNAFNSINEGDNDGWNFTTANQRDLYWIGGQGNWSDPTHWSLTSGGSPTPNSCIPNPVTNTFFDQNSGFLSTSKSVILDSDAFTNNITFQENEIPPSLEVIKIRGSYGSAFLEDVSLNIHGNSILQEGMTTDLRTIFYKDSFIDSQIPKIIKSNNVAYNVKNNIYLDAAIRYDLEDSFHLKTGSLIIRNGDFYTNDHNLKIDGQGKLEMNSNRLSTYSPNLNQLSKSLNLGNSTLEFDMSQYNYNVLITNTSNTVFEAGTSTIIFKREELSTDNFNYFSVNNGQKFHNVTFFVSPLISQSNLLFNDVYFYQNANISGSNNSFNKMYLAPNQTFLFQVNATQTINSLILGGTPCAYTIIGRYGGSGVSRANLKITGGENNYYNYTTINNINVVDKSLHFQAQSEVGANNINITFETPNRDSFPGLGTNWLNHTVDTQNPSTYILNTKYFNPNIYSTYEWKKTTGLNSNLGTVISEVENLDFRPFGYGTFNAKVTYSDFLGGYICSRDASLLITPGKGFINPNQRAKVKKTINELIQ